MTIKLCACGCKEGFYWDSNVILVNDELYHKGCVDVYPSNFFAMLDGEVLGETENEDGSNAFEYLDEDELVIEDKDFEVSE